MRFMVLIRQQPETTLETKLELCATISIWEQTCALSYTVEEKLAFPAEEEAKSGELSAREKSLTRLRRERAPKSASAHKEKVRNFYDLGFLTPYLYILDVA